mmetsp:Transcript_13354/g.27128  ORF Transcript_13354/g.27128 Transcript_13354/m.27128 type:complete len:210 (+) Transcript_13354:746-1375(+)
MKTMNATRYRICLEDASLPIISLSLRMVVPMRSPAFSNCVPMSLSIRFWLFTSSPICMASFEPMPPWFHTNRHPSVASETLHSNSIPFLNVRPSSYPLFPSSYPPASGCRALLPLHREPPTRLDSQMHPHRLSPLLRENQRAILGSSGTSLPIPPHRSPVLHRHHRHHPAYEIPCSSTEEEGVPSAEEDTTRIVTSGFPKQWCASGTST